MIAANSQNGRNFKEWRIYEGNKKIATVHDVDSPEKQQAIAKKFAAVDDLLESCKKGGLFFIEAVAMLQGNPDAAKIAESMKEAIDKATV